MIINQIKIFMICLIDGIIIGFLFDIFRIFRKIHKTSTVLTYIQDIIFLLLSRDINNFFFIFL